jgi:hypothetical protein
MRRGPGGVETTPHVADGSSYTAHPEDLDVLDATFARPDLTTFCRLDALGLEVTGQRLESDRAVLACRVVELDQWCRRCGAEGSARDTVTRRLAHEPLGWRPTTLLVTVRRYRCAGCGHVWRQDTSRAAEPRARLSRRGLRWALEGVAVRGARGPAEPLSEHAAVDGGHAVTGTQLGRRTRDVRDVDNHHPARPRVPPLPGHDGGVGGASRRVATATTPNATTTTATTDGARRASRARQPKRTRSTRSAWRVCRRGGRQSRGQP